MKKILSILLAVWMFVLFLNYSGFFRDDTDPVKVTEYYFKCMREGDWTLTYQVTIPKYFDHQELLDLRAGMFLKEKVKEFKSKLVSSEGDTAHVKTCLFFGDKGVVNCVTILERGYGKKWYIKETRYDRKELA